MTAELTQTARARTLPLRTSPAASPTPSDAGNHGLERSRVFATLHYYYCTYKLIINYVCTTPRK